MVISPRRLEAAKLKEELEESVLPVVAAPVLAQQQDEAALFKYLQGLPCASVVSTERGTIRFVNHAVRT
jgi:hypothetical protein